MSEDRAWEDAQERNIGRAELEAELAEERELRKKAEIERDFAKEILVEQAIVGAERHLRSI